ncbi:MAG: hypothetical protein P5702_02480 [Limnospira sp. PMC 1291.21]|uniref:Glucose-inhibited division protein A n=3 Tax=Limnospira TaxID=2596745 RepID=A0A9P1P2U6_9CYAN|nr:MULTISPECIES: hypothetical protein [Limnospira]MDC0839217.1 hypothetical protein [Limnoraphis robusta]MDY7051807.1 hypothetical protein [Limnospira fusiformis LS22]QJB29384.1 hypothetical protein HFV01_30585 [Limnospira fusiformis SAG 85.79]UWU45986.1 hypothetical protein APLC1_0670 [Arthrospira platensis C1]EDZ96440.1 hypothetical protein AmaxDRAFT_0771 [Limnospira maxima CS-328]
MERSKVVAYITGAISIILAIAYLLLVSILDFRGEMLPAPQSQVTGEISIASVSISGEAMHPGGGSQTGFYG